MKTKVNSLTQALAAAGMFIYYERTIIAKFKKTAGRTVTGI